MQLKQSKKMKFELQVKNINDKFCVNLSSLLKFVEEIIVLPESEEAAEAGTGEVSERVSKHSETTKLTHPTPVFAE